MGLLNIGAEEIKGNEQVKKTAQLLSDSDSINYTGYVEGDDIFNGTTDVIVCDGFVGNVALKSGEGIAKLIAQVLKQVFSDTWWSRMVGAMALPVLRRLKKRIDPARYNGASLLGLRGIVVKSHGGADEVAFAYAIAEALKEVEHDVLDRIQQQLTQVFEVGKTDAL